MTEKRTARPPKGDFLDIVFRGEPGPGCACFIEAEDGEGHSIDAGEWIEQEDGIWILRLTGESIRRAAMVRKWWKERGASADDGPASPSDHPGPP